LKKTLALLLAISLIAGLFSGCASGTPKQTLNVLNWGEYMDDTVIQQFSKEYNVEINYNTTDSNEAMYAVVSTEGSQVDVIFPSDYMIERLIREERLHEINYANIPNFKYISDFCKNRNFDPGNKYSVPYTWGTVGILYNKDMVTDPVDSWSILWDEKYKDNIYMYDSKRDSIAVALKKLGYSLNTKNTEEIKKAGQKLKEQKPLVKAYGTDDIKQSIISGSGALGVVYSGDAVVSLMENENLGYCFPKEGSNIWFDNATIMKNSKNPELAEKFINFLLDPEIGLKNTEYISYSSPNAEVMKNIGKEYLDISAFNPPQDVIDNCEVYADLDADESIKALYEQLWNDIRAQ
jgi:spermidine/putrescine transport system substrate-binding protein